MQSLGNDSKKALRRRDLMLLEAASVRMKIAKHLDEDAGLRLVSPRIAAASDEEIVRARERAEIAAERVVILIRERDAMLAEVYRALYIDRLSQQCIASLFGISRWTAYRRRDELLELMHEDPDISAAVKDWCDATASLDETGKRKSRADRP